MSDSRTSVKANQEVDAYRGHGSYSKGEERERRGGGERYMLMDVRLPKIETPYVDDETGSLPVADFRESASPPPGLLIKHGPAHPLADVMTSHSGITDLRTCIGELFRARADASEIYTFVRELRGCC